MNAAEQKKQDDYFKSNINNLVIQANARTSPRFSPFLDERQQDMAEEILRHNRWEDSAIFFGGTENCERRMLGVFPPEIEPDPSFFPISALRIIYSGKTTLSHRDYLGALMSLQLKRETVGDIVPLPPEDSAGNGAVLFLSRDVAEFVRLNLEQIGRTSVNIEEISCTDVKRTQEFEELTGTVPSLRLDCVAAMLMNKSRSIAVQAVEAGFVKINGLEAFRVSKLLEPGDTVVIRGYGKFLLGDELKKTKKDRIFLTVKKYV